MNAGSYPSGGVVDIDSRQSFRPPTVRQLPIFGRDALNCDHPQAASIIACGLEGLQVAFRKNGKTGICAGAVMVLMRWQNPANIVWPKVDGRTIICLVENEPSHRREELADALFRDGAAAIYLVAGDLVRHWQNGGIPETFPPGSPYPFEGLEE